MNTSDIIVAVELGSSKMTGIAGCKHNDGSIEVLAVAQEDSTSYIRKGVIFNLDRTSKGIVSIIKKLEDELHTGITKVYTGIGGLSLRTLPNLIVRDLPQETLINEELTQSLRNENLTMELSNKNILQVVPQEFKVDHSVQVDPIGLVGKHIEGKFLNIVIRSSACKNMYHCFQQAGVQIAELMISPLKTADVLLTDSERRSGCALVDIGADTTTVSVYKNNILRYMSVIPMGGDSITHDITSLNIEEEVAENLKISYGDALYTEDKDQEPSYCHVEGWDHDIKTLELNNIIGARAEELVENVWNQIGLSGYERKLFAGIVITGGGALLKNLDLALRQRCNINHIRTATVPRTRVTGKEDLIKAECRYNTIIGILEGGKQNCCVKKTDNVIPSQVVIDLFGNETNPSKPVERKKHEKQKKEKANQNNWLKKSIGGIATLFSEGEDEKME